MVREVDIIARPIAALTVAFWDSDTSTIVLGNWKYYQQRKFYLFNLKVNWQMHIDGDPVPATLLVINHEVMHQILEDFVGDYASLALDYWCRFVCHDDFNGIPVESWRMAANLNNGSDVHF